MIMTLEGQMRSTIQAGRNDFNRLQDQYIYHLRDVDVSFGAIQALEGINLTINPAEILFVTGKSGAGKTTLLNVLAEDVKSTSGEYFGPNTKGKVAQVFQDLRLFQNKTCEENLWYAFDRKIYKNKNEFYSDMQELASILGIKDRLGLKVKDVNGGMKQKVAMIRALLAKPSVLIADEPTASLDKESSIKLFDVLNFYNVKRKLTVIWASHNRDLVKQFPGKIIHLENGKLVYSGHACFI